MTKPPRLTVGYFAQHQLDELDPSASAYLHIRRLMPDAVHIFILPPSIEVLESRLRGRATDSEEVIARRLSEARTEIDQVAEYDYVISNDDFALARLDLISIIRTQRLHANRQCLQHKAAITAMQSAQGDLLLFRLRGAPVWGGQRRTSRRAHHHQRGCEGGHACALPTLRI